MEVLLGMHEKDTSAYSASLRAHHVKRSNALEVSLGLSEVSKMGSASEIHLKPRACTDTFFQLKLPATPPWRKRFPLERLPDDIKCQLLYSLDHLRTLKLLLLASADLHHLSKLVRSKLLRVYKDDIIASRQQPRSFDMWSPIAPSCGTDLRRFEGFLPYVDKVYWNGMLSIERL